MDLVVIVRSHWDRLLALVAVLLGTVLLILGWLGVSGSLLTTQQLPYLISGGLGGMLCMAVSGTLWLSADLADEWRKLDDIHAELKRLGELGAPMSTVDQNLNGQRLSAPPSSERRPDKRRSASL